MNAARTSSLAGIASAVGKIGPGALSSAWNGITGNPDPSPAGTLDLTPLNSFSTGTVGGGTGSAVGGFGSGINWGF